MVFEVEIKTVSGLAAIIPKLRNKKDGGSIFYRGESAFYPTRCMPTLFRKEAFVRRERYYHNEFCRRFPETVDGLASDLSRMVLMQHYTVPTRLLDLTENPLVALHFALSGEAQLDHDGVIYCVKAHYRAIHYERNSEVVRIASLVRASSAPYFDGMDDYRKVLLVKPPWRNNRIKAQQGVMALFGCGCSRLEAASMREWFDTEAALPKDEPVLYAAIRIPASAKRGLLTELEDLGISESFIFPELPHLANDLKRKNAIRALDLDP